MFDCEDRGQTDVLSFSEVIDERLTLDESLQTAAVDDLEVNGELAATIVDDEDTDAATTVVKGLGQADEQAALVKDRETLLDVTALGHGDNGTVITDVQDAVLLEDGADHVLDVDGRAGVAGEGGLLVQLLGEEVNTEVAVLAGLGRGGDADDLARATLEDQQVTNADVVARDGDGGGSDGARAGSWSRHGDFAFFNDDVFLALGAVGVVVVMVVRLAFKGVKDAVGCAVESLTE
jgi:hypothetical protein